MKLIKRFKLSPLLNNTYLISDGGKTILIDAPGEIYKVITYLDENELTLDEVYLTHIHIDHIIGLNELKKKYPDLKVYISPLEKEIINDSKSNLSYGYELGEFHLDFEVYDNSILESKNLKIKYISGHSKQSSVYVYIKEEIMFTGDVLFNGTIGRSDLIYGDQNTLVKQIKDELLSFDNFIVYPGHGFSTTIKDEKKGNEFLNV